MTFNVIPSHLLPFDMSTIFISKVVGFFMRPIDIVHVATVSPLPLSLLGTIVQSNKRMLYFST